MLHSSRMKTALTLIVALLWAAQPALASERGGKASVPKGHRRAVDKTPARTDGHPFGLRNAWIDPSSGKPKKGGKIENVPMDYLLSLAQGHIVTARISTDSLFKLIRHLTPSEEDMPTNQRISLAQERLFSQFESFRRLRDLAPKTLLPLINRDYPNRLKIRIPVVQGEFARAGTFAVDIGGPRDYVDPE